MEPYYTYYRQKPGSKLMLGCIVLPVGHKFKLNDSTVSTINRKINPDTDLTTREVVNLATHWHASKVEPNHWIGLNTVRYFDFSIGTKAIVFGNRIREKDFPGHIAGTEKYYDILQFGVKLAEMKNILRRFEV